MPPPLPPDLLLSPEAGVDLVDVLVLALQAQTDRVRACGCDRSTAI